EGEFVFTAYLLLEPEGAGTRYTAAVVHQTAAAKAQHEAMGFHEGWGIALDQLVAFMKARHH
ncbi:MAG: SRPBCC domain-containing protein, partial [Oceanisphaera sp.]|nr:SRPBCC domain-containing protein [Oceanisphaera sp.]